VRLVDTNVLLYAISTDKNEAAKTAIARAVLGSSDLALSVQVLQEFYVQATRSSRRHRLSHEQASLLVEAWLRFPVQDTTVPIVQAAFATAFGSGISYWDAAVIEAARALGCTTVLSEDLADGRDYAGVRIENPFRSISQP